MSGKAVSLHAQPLATVQPQLGQKRITKGISVSTLASGTNAECHQAKAYLFNGSASIGVCMDVAPTFEL